MVRVRWWWSQQIERGQKAIVWHLPRWLIYWALIRCWAHATTAQYGTTHPDEITWHEALRRWGTPHE